MHFLHSLLPVLCVTPFTYVLSVLFVCPSVSLKQCVTSQKSSWMNTVTRLSCSQYTKYCSNHSSPESSAPCQRAFHSRRGPVAPSGAAPPHQHSLLGHDLLHAGSRREGKTLLLHALTCRFLPFPPAGSRNCAASADRSLLDLPAAVFPLAQPNLEKRSWGWPGPSFRAGQAGIFTLHCKVHRPIRQTLSIQLSSASLLPSEHRVLWLCSDLQRHFFSFRTDDTTGGCGNVRISSFKCPRFGDRHSCVLFPKFLAQLNGRIRSWGIQIKKPSGNLTNIPSGPSSLTST